MISIRLRLAVAVLSMVSAISARAEDPAAQFAAGESTAPAENRGPAESPPNEPPYTTTDDEFNRADEQAGGSELKAGEDGRSIEELLNDNSPPPAEAAGQAPLAPHEEDDLPVVESGDENVAAEPSAPVPSEPPPGQATVAPNGETIVIDSNGTKRIRHPMAQQGLRLIDRDGSYYYSPKRSTQHVYSSSVRLGAIQPPRITSADQKTTFENMYGESNPATMMYDFEWQPLQFLGRWGVQLGFGVFSAQGAGRFATTGEEARERYTFYALPLNAGLVYRFQYLDSQWIAPYVMGGASYFALAEFRDDGKTPHFVGTPTGYGGGGLMINLSALDRNTGFALDSEYGIHTMWLTAEGRAIQSSNEDLDFSGFMVSLGVTVDY